MQPDLPIIFHRSDRSAIDPFIAATAAQNFLPILMEWLPGHAPINEILLKASKVTKKIVLVTSKALTNHLDDSQRLDEAIAHYEERGVQILLGLTHDVSITDLPAPLLLCSFINLSTATGISEGLSQISGQGTPRGMAYKDLSKQLKTPGQGNNLGYPELRHYLFQLEDRRLQVPAVIGLEKLGGPDAVRILTERVLDGFLINVLERSMKALWNLTDDGGLLSLIAILPFDYRFTHVKQNYIYSYMQEEGFSEQALQFKEITIRYRLDSEFSIALPLLCDAMRTTGSPDLTCGSELAMLFGKHLDKALPSQVLPAGLASNSIDYVENRIPGFFDMVWEHHNALGRFMSKDKG